MPAEATALVSAEFPARATARPRGPPTYIRETLRRNYGSLMLPLPSHLRLCSRRFQLRSRFLARFTDLPSQTISVGHFWPLMDVDLLIGLSLGEEATFAVRRCVVCVRCAYICLCAWTRARFDGQYRNAVAGIISYQRYWLPRISLTGDRCWRLRVIVTGGADDSKGELVLYLQFCYRKSDYISVHRYTGYAHFAEFVLIEYICADCSFIPCTFSV